MVRVRVSSKNQIVVPAEARKKLGIKPGNYLLVNVRDHSIVLVPETEDPVGALKGLGQDIWAGVDSDKWLREERESWETRQLELEKLIEETRRHSARTTE
jgi:AbrB family looped-hinge helix DNA binding protein